MKYVTNNQLSCTRWWIHQRAIIYPSNPRCSSTSHFVVHYSLAVDEDSRVLKASTQLVGIDEPKWKMKNVLNTTQKLRDNKPKDTYQQHVNRPSFEHELFASGNCYLPVYSRHPPLCPRLLKLSHSGYDRYAYEVQQHTINPKPFFYNFLSWQTVTWTEWEQLWNIKQLFKRGINPKLVKFCLE